MSSTINLPAHTTISVLVVLFSINSNVCAFHLVSTFFWHFRWNYLKEGGNSGTFFPFTVPDLKRCGLSSLTVNYWAVNIVHLLLTCQLPLNLSLCSPHIRRFPLSCDSANRRHNFIDSQPITGLQCGLVNRFNPLWEENKERFESYSAAEKCVLSCLHIPGACWLFQSFNVRWRPLHQP